MKSRLLYLLTACLWYAASAQAQVYEPGYVVRATGDTLRGEIENAFWEEAPTAIRFRSIATAESQVFTRHQVRAVNFTGGRAFRYAILPIDHAAKSKIGDLPYENVPNIKIDTVLAEVLVDGPMSLVRVPVFDRATHYVLLSPGRPPLDLSERKYLRQTVDKAWLLTNGNNYKGQLGVYFADCPNAHAASQRASFTAKALVDVVQTYNVSCSAQHRAGLDVLARAGNRSSVALVGGVMGGVRYNRTSPTSDDLRTRSEQGPCADCKPHPFAGAYGELLMPSRSAAIYGELTVSTFRSRTTQFFPSIYSYGTFDYRAWLSTARLGLRYFVPLAHEQRLVFGIGYELNLVHSPTYTSSTLTNSQLLPNTLKLEYAKATFLPNVTLGWRRERLTVTLDGQMYVTSSGIDAGLSGAYFGSDFAARLGLSYRLGRHPDQAGSTAPAKH